MTDLARGQAARRWPGGSLPGSSPRAGAVTPSPLSIPPRPRAAMPDSGRAAARAALDDALRGVELTGVDRRFVSRLSQWDKRTATTLAGLVGRARQAGRAEALAPGQLEVVFAALLDAFAYRTCGAPAAGCWDCANLASGLCAEHAKDADRAHAFAELALMLSASVAHIASDPVRPVAAAAAPGARSPVAAAAAPAAASRAAAGPGPARAATPAAPVTAVTSASPVTPTALARYRRRAAVAS